MGGPFPQHGVRHAALDLAQGGPPPRTPGDRAHRLGSVSPLPALPALSSRCASLRRGQSKPCGLRHPPAPPHASLALAGQRLTSPAGCVSSHTSLAAQRGEAATPPLAAEPAEQPRPTGRTAATTLLAAERRRSGHAYAGEAASLPGGERRSLIGSPPATSCTGRPALWRCCAGSIPIFVYSVAAKSSGEWTLSEA